MVPGFPQHSPKDRSGRAGAGCARFFPTSPDAMSTDLHPEQIRAIRAMSHDRRMEIGMALLKSARRMRRAGLRQQHPDWSEEELDDALRRWTRDAGV